AFGALQKICEDSAEILDSDVLDRPLNIMIPKFLQFFKHSSPKIRDSQRFHASVISMFVCLQSHLFIQSANDFENHIVSFKFLHIIRKNSMMRVFDLLLLGTDTTLCLLMEFTFRRKSNAGSIVLVPVLILHSVMVMLIPVLVNGMKYSEIDIILLKGDVEEDEAIPDSEQDIRPRFHRSKTVAQQHEEDGIEDDDDDDDELDDDDTISDWNL
ncbi:TNPO1 protein, partial [Grallaria varia]|nr:TNPO1 protein [Grallaria varia]